MHGDGSIIVYEIDNQSGQVMHTLLENDGQFGRSFVQDLVLEGFKAEQT